MIHTYIIGTTLPHYTNSLLPNTTFKMGLLPDKSFKANSKIAEQVDQKANPFDDETQHNEGQPIRQNIDQFGNQRSKFLTDCKAEHRNSLQCIEDNYDRREVCQPFFDAYKECRRLEHQKKMEMNNKATGGSGESESCVIS